MIMNKNLLLLVIININYIYYFLIMSFELNIRKCLMKKKNLFLD